jgi:hypothetical protein
VHHGQGLSSPFELDAGHGEVALDVAQPCDHPAQLGLAEGVAFLCRLAEPEGELLVGSVVMPE